MKNPFRRALAQSLLPSLVLLGAGGVAAAPQKPASAKPVLTSASPGRSPQTIYRTTCAYCHGHNVGPVIRGRGLEPEVVRHFVRNGQGAMPPFRPTEVSPAELEALASWIQASAADHQEHGK
jgi:mono/diheme cytochrome c family protein